MAFILPGVVRFTVDVKKTTSNAFDAASLLDDFKLHLRVDWVDEDALITELINVAVGYIESATGALFTNNDFEQRGGWRQAERILLLRGPVTEIVEVQYFIDLDRVAQILDSAAYEFSGQYLITLEACWPTIDNTQEQPVKITFKAGNAGLTDLARQAALLLVGHWYQNREVVIKKQVENLSMPFGAQALLEQVREEAGF